MDRWPWYWDEPSPGLGEKGVASHLDDRQETGSSPLLAGLTDREGTELCARLRRELVEQVSRTGGHLASNLGAVELTVAIHRVFDTRTDRLEIGRAHV